MLGISLNSLHVQYNGDIIQRLDTYEHPLMMQNEYLVGIGYCDLDRIQEEGTNEDLGYLIRFYYGKSSGVRPHFLLLHVFIVFFSTGVGSLFF